MHWTRLRLKEGGYAENTTVSETGYTVLRCTTNGVATGRFIAFLVDGHGTRTVLGGYDSAEDAKAACCAHWAKRHEVAA